MTEAFEAITAYPAGHSTVARFADVAGDLGYSGLVVRNTAEIPASPTLEAIADRADIEVAEGIELAPDDPTDVSGRLPGLGRSSSIVSVAGGTRDRNRFVASQSHVDVLATPIGPDGPDLAAGTVKTAIENDVAIELALDPLRRPGGTRVRYVDRLLRLWRLVDHYDAPFVVSIRPTDHRELAAPRSLCALGDEIGIGAAAVEAGLAKWGTLASRADATAEST